MYRNAAARVSLMASVAASFLLAGARCSPAKAGREGADGGLCDAARKVGAAARLPAGRARRAPPESRDPQRGRCRRRARARRARRRIPSAQRQFGLSQPEPQMQFEGASDDDNAAVRRITDRAAGHRRRRRPEPLHPVHQQHRRDLRQDRQHRARPVPGQRVLGRPRRALRGPERRRPARPVRPAGRPLGVLAVRASQLPRTARSTSASRSRRRTIRPATTTSTSSRRATTSSPTTESSASGPTPTTCRSTCSAPTGEFQGGAYAFDRAAMLAGAPGRHDRLRHGTGGRRAAVGPGRADAAAGRLAELLHDLRRQSRAPARVAVPRRLDDAGQQHVHRAGRDPGRPSSSIPVCDADPRPVRSPARDRRRSSRPSTTS